MSRSGVRRLLLLALTIGCPSILHGQRLMGPGSTVRLTVTDTAEPLIGALLSMTDEAWRVGLPDGEVRSIDPARVVAAEVQVTHRNTLRGTLIGAGLGLTTGLLLFATYDDDCDGDIRGLCETVVGLTKGPTLMVGTLGGAALGAGVGALIRSEGWVPGIVPNGIGGGVALRWSLSAGH